MRTRARTGRGGLQAVDLRRVGGTVRACHTITTGPKRREGRGKIQTKGQSRIRDETVAVMKMKGGGWREGDPT